MKRSFILLIASFIVVSLIGQSAIHNHRLEKNENQVFQILKQITRNNQNLANPFSSPNDLKQAMDSSIYEEFHQFDEGWRNERKLEYNWDENGRETKRTQSMWYMADEIWVTYEKSDYTYDESGKLLLIKTLQKLGGNEDWEDYQKTEFTYDGNTGISAILSFWNPDLNQWFIFWKHEYIFDNDGKILEITNYYNEETPTLWLNGEKYEYSYDVNSRLIQELWLEWDIESSDWSNAYKLDYSYNNNGNLISEELIYWNWNIQQWISESKLEFTYDDHGNISEDIVSDWYYDTEEWLVESKVTYSYDNSFTYDDLILPSNFYGYNNLYDIIIFNHMLIKEELFEAFDGNWDEDVRTTYYYSENNTSYVEINNDDGFLVYPNPASDYFIIELNNISESVLVEVFDTHGRKVFSQEINENQPVSVRDLDKGVYVYKFGYDGNLFSGKILIQ